MSTAADAERLARLTAAALQQPGARERATGMIKFQCPACAADGHDAHQDNAGLFADTATWGCAFAKDTPDGRRHWDAIGRALGAFDHRNGHDAAEPRAYQDGHDDHDRDHQAAAAGHGPSADTTAVDWPLYDAADSWDFPPVEFTVEGLLPTRGVVWIGGLPKRYKSLFMLYTCLAIAARHDRVAKHFPVLRNPKILYIAREDGGSRLQTRRDDIITAWRAGPTPGALRFVIRPHLDLLEPVHVAWLRDTCRRESITLLVIDTWTALSPSADPMAAQDQAALARVVVQLAEDIDGAVVVIDHSRKNRPDGATLSSADILGPSQKWQAAEHVVMLDVVSAADRRIECFVESKDADTGRFFLVASPGGSAEEKFAYAGTSDEIAAAQRARGDRNREAVYRALAEAGRGMTAAALTEALKARGTTLAQDTVSSHLGGLVEAGRATKNGKGRMTQYRATADSRQGPSTANADQPREDLYAPKI